MGHRLSPEAEAELDGIWYYIANKSGSIDIADRFVDSLTERFRRRDADLGVGILSFPVGKFIIVYRIEEEAVLILHVVRGSRNLEALFGA